MQFNDPIGQAIEDYLNGTISAVIIVQSDLSEDDEIPVSYLFRNIEDMPALEQIAIENCTGTVLDVGCGSGPHMRALSAKGISCEGIEASKKAAAYVREQGFIVYTQNFLSFSEKKYDTLLLLMNGLGLAGKLQNLSQFLLHAKSLLKEGGKILCDSTDVRYFYEDEEGSVWIDLNATYYGEFKFKMQYKSHTTDWFDWLYVDFQTLKTTAESVGLSCTCLHADEATQTFLAEIK
jgi:SAM-dependent methyltransferase